MHGHNANTCPGGTFDNSPTFQRRFNVGCASRHRKSPEGTAEIGYRELRDTTLEVQLAPELLLTPGGGAPSPRGWKNTIFGIAKMRCSQPSKGRNTDTVVNWSRRDCYRFPRVRSQRPSRLSGPSGRG